MLKFSAENLFSGAGFFIVETIFFTVNWTMSDLRKTAQLMMTPGKGILAIDESHRTCQKRFSALGVDCTEESRRHYRQLLVTAPQIENSLSGMILFEETLYQKDDNGVLFSEILAARGILPGIKVDLGLMELPLHAGEQITKGLDDLSERLEKYHQAGAKFAKWRAVITIDTAKNLPSEACLKANAHGLARYAAACQAAGLVPMVEPEILYDGTHDQSACAEACHRVWVLLMEELKAQGVDLQATVLKTSFVLNGRESGTENQAGAVAQMTVEIFKKSLPEELAGIVFLSGGLTDQESTAFLQAIHAEHDALPWPVSFSFGRGIQSPALKLWAADPQQNYEPAQKVLAHRAQLCALASSGKYSPELESA